MFTDDKIDIGGAGAALDLKIAKEIFSELEVYLNKPIEKISEVYWSRKEAKEQEEQERIIKTGSADEITSYYKTTEQFLYELMYWEALKSKQVEFRKLYLICRRLRINRLLDFGGGVGGLGIFMANHGLKCDYLDLPGKTFDFAKWRFNRRGLNIQLYPKVDALPPSSYNAVICYDVLEHLFDVEETIKEIGRILDDKGFLISRSTFNDEGVHLTKNKKFQNIRIFDELMGKYNFRFLGQLKPDYASQFLKYLGIKHALLGVRIKRRLKYGGNFIVYQKRGQR